MTAIGKILKARGIASSAKTQIPSKFSRAGFTLIEALVMIVLSVILIIGFRYTLLAYWEQMNRSMTERHIQQYGSSIVEYVARKITNAREIYIPPNAGDLSTFTATFFDPNKGNVNIIFSANKKNWVMEDNERIFREFPPKRSDNSYSGVIGLNETVEIIKFGIDSIRRIEPPYNNTEDFYGRLYRVTLLLRYTREWDKDEQPYIKNMTFSSQISMKMHGAEEEAF